MSVADRVEQAIGMADLSCSAASLPNVPMADMARYIKQASDEGHYKAMARAAIEAMNRPIAEYILKMDQAVIYYEGDDCAGGNLWHDFRAALMGETE